VVNEFFRYFDIDSYREPALLWRLGPFKLYFKGEDKNKRVEEELLFHGRLFILTSSSSFSSAMIFPQMIKDNGLGKIIGESPANDPNGYGEVVHHRLPESNIFMMISSKHFLRVNQNTSEKYVEPDYPCESKKAIEELYRQCANPGNPTLP